MSTQSKVASATSEASIPNNTISNTTPSELVVVLNPHDIGFSEFHGTRAMLQDEGIIPNEIKWPKGYDYTRWEDENFFYSLCRMRPDGAKGSRKQFIDCDWFHLRWELKNRPSHVDRLIAIKTQELKDLAYRQSTKGSAERDAMWSSYFKSQKDEKFQAFKALVPGLIPVKRGRKSTSKEVQ